MAFPLVPAKILATHFGDQMRRIMISLALAAIAGCQDSSTKSGNSQQTAEGAQSAKSNASATSTTKPSEPTAPDFKSSSRDYAEEFLKDKQAFVTKYKDKIVELTGEVVHVGGGNPRYIGLVGSMDGRVPTISCDTSKPRTWDRATPGQTVRIRGRCLNPVMEGPLFECEILEVTGPTAPAISADEVAKAHVSDADAAKKKWLKKTLLLSGEVAGKEKSDIGEQFLILKAADGPAIRIRWGYETDDLKRLSVGQTVRVLAEYFWFSNDKNRIEFISGSLMR
jgi:tRNA_anti-like